MSHKLITYAWHRGFAKDTEYAMDITTLDPIEWLACALKVEPCEGMNPCYYFILSVVPVTEEQAFKYSENLRGM